MEFPRPLTPDSAVTPFRETRTVLGGSEFALTRQRAHFSRRADEMYPAFAGGEVADVDEFDLDPDDVYYLRTCGWILPPYLLQQANQLKANAVAQMLDGNELGNLAPGILSEYRWRKPALPGVVYDPDVVNQARPAYVREGAAGDDYGQELTADAAAFPPPGLPNSSSLKRVFAGTKTYAPNTVFLFEFFVPGVNEDGGYLYGFSFGGPAETTPKTQQCTGWYVGFRGDGVATLWERVNGRWRRQQDFRWSEPGRARSGWQYVVIFPHAQDKLVFLVPSAATSRELEASNPLSPRAFPAKASDTHFALYHHSAPRSGHAYRKHISGQGCVRVDMRQNLAGRFAVGASNFPTGAAFVDRPLPLKQRVRAGSKMTLKVDADLPPRTSLTPKIMNADTGEECPLGTDPNTWLTVEDQTRYCVKFLFASEDGEQTPTLKGYGVEVEGQFEVTTDTSVEAPGPDSVNLTPGGGDPTLDQGFLAYTDLLDQLSRLRNRGSVPLQLITTIDDAGTESCLFKGRTLGALRRVLYETDGGELPVYETEVIGRWARLQERKTREPFTYAQDPDGSTAPDGTPNPWKITAAIDDLLDRAGVPEAERHIPIRDSDVHLWPGKSAAAYIIPANTPYLTLAIELARNYLDAYLIYDPNSGVAGMWRLVFNPEQPDNNILWRFVDTATVEYTPGGDPIPNLPHTPDAYEDGVTYIEEIHFERFMPEANHVVIRGLDPDSTSSNGGYQILAEKHNPNSYTADPDYPTATDPDHPDYVGYEILEAFTDASVQTKEEAAWLCARIYDLIAHGLEIASLVAPLVFVTDPNDPVQTQPRPLRFGDPVLVNGRTGVVKACLPFYTSDRKQMARMQVVMVPDGDTKVKSFGPSLCEQQRKAAQAAAAEPFARSAHQRIWSTAVHGVDQEAEIASLPIAPGGRVELTTKDGKEQFIVGFHSPFSPDTVLSW